MEHPTDIVSLQRDIMEHPKDIPNLQRVFDMTVQLKELNDRVDKLSEELASTVELLDTTIEQMGQLKRKVDEYPLQKKRDAWDIYMENH